MTKQLRSTKIFIYISIFGCLLNLVANEEGNFYLTGFEGKSWKFDLNETIPNGKTLADELKSKKAMSLKFTCELWQLIDDENKRDIYCWSEIKNVNFTKATESSFFQPYDIIVECNEETSYLRIVLENTIDEINGVKIGQLKNGTNSLSEFNSAVIEKEHKFVETLTLGYSEEPIEDKCKIGWIIAILFGGTLLAGGLYLLLSLCL